MLDRAPSRRRAILSRVLGWGSGSSWRQWAGARISAVSHRRRKISITLILATALACPMLEMFDRWDDTARTGNDTETAIVVIVLCVGVALIGARIVVRSARDSSSRLDA